MAEKKTPARSRKKPAAAADATDESLIPDTDTPPAADMADTVKADTIEDAVVLPDEPQPDTERLSEDAIPDAGVSDAPEDKPADTPEASEAPAPELDPEDAPKQAEADVAPDVAAKPASEKPTPEKIVECVVEKRGSPIPMVLAGVAVAAVGFFAGASNLIAPGTDAPQVPDLTADVAALGDRVSGLESGIGDLDARIAAIAPADTGPIDQRLSDLDAAVQAVTQGQSDLDARLTALDARITELATLPVTEGASEAAVAAFEAELTALQSAIADQRAEVEQMVATARASEASAAEQARQAEVKAAIARLVSAIDRGDSLDAELVALGALGVEVPAALSSLSTGVPTLSSLQSAFPDAARAALSAARTGEGGDAGVTTWLQRQLGARSVTPRDGADPDAVLSRAEAALTAGRLDQALEEIAALPDAAKPALTAWSDAAQARLAATTAIDDLAAALASN